MHTVLDGREPPAGPKPVEHRVSVGTGPACSAARQPEKWPLELGNVISEQRSVDVETCLEPTVVLDRLNRGGSTERVANNPDTIQVKVAVET